MVRRVPPSGFGGAARTPPNLLRSSAVVSGGDGDLAEQPVVLVVRACGEVEVVGVTRPAAVPEADAPEAVDRDRLAVVALELPLGLPLAVLLRLEDVDLTVAEVADEQVAAR